MRRVFGFLLILLTACGEDPPDEGPSPSIVLITLDTTRADRLGCYGHTLAETPNMDALAAQGVLFEQTRSPVPITLPSHATILTGTYPPYHGLRTNGAAALGSGATSLAELAKERGYATGAFVSAYVLDADYGLNQGFDEYGDVPSRQLISGGFVEERDAEETIDLALEWLKDVEGPYFLWVHLFDPHAAYIARLSRGGMLEILSQDYIRTARAKGLPQWMVVGKHALRGGLIPVVAFLGPAFAHLLAGSFVVETIFQIPGLP